jgi:hypothetical protein
MTAPESVTTTPSSASVGSSKEVARAQVAFATAGLFVLSHGIAVASFMVLLRRHMGSGLPSVGAALLHLMAVVGVVLGLLELARRYGIRSSAAMAVALGVALSVMLPVAGLFFGQLGLVIPAGAAIAGILLLVKTLESAEEATGITIAAVCAAGLISGVIQSIISSGDGYAQVFSYEFALLGWHAPDTVFHAAIAELIANYGIPTTGVDGTRPLFYHVLSHVIVAGISREAGEIALLAYPPVQQILFIPILLLAGSFAVTAFSRFSLFSAAVAPVATLFLWSLYDLLGGWNSFLLSESYALSVTLLLFGLPLALRGPTNTLHGIIAWLAVTGLIGSLSVLAKFTVAFAWVVAGIGGVWSSQRQSHPTVATCAVAVGTAVYLLLVYFLYSWGTAGVEFLAFARAFTAAYIVSIAASCAAIMCVFLLRAHRPETPSPFIFIAFALCLHIPTILFKVPGGGQYYWFDPTDRVAIVIIVATAIALMEAAKPRLLRSSSIAVAVATVGTLILAAATRSFDGASKLATTLVSFDRLAAIGRVPPRFEAGSQPAQPAQMTPAMIEAAVVIAKHLATGVPAAASLAIGETPLARTVRSIDIELSKFPRGRPALVIGMNNNWYWQGPYSCITRNFNFQALTGTVLMAGIPDAGATNCPEVAYYGMASYGATSRASKLAPADYCAAARARDLSPILLVRDPDLPIARIC